MTNYKNPVFIIAEMSANHNQDFNLAVKTIEGMARAGADAVKVQTYTPDTITLNSDNEFFQITQGTIWDGTTLYNLYKTAYTPWEWHEELQRVAHELGLVFFSTPFDFSAVDFLDDLNVPIFKIASFEIHDIPLIQYIAQRGKPILISTGIATYEEIAEAINAIREIDTSLPITVLKCTSAYPTPLDDVNLQTMADIKRHFQVDVGVSDHTKGHLVPVMAISLGATTIEKHFILNDGIMTPDSSFSMNETEFTEMVHLIRQAEQALGTVTYELSKKQLASREHGRSLFVSKNVNAGDTISLDNIKSVRPANGLRPKFLYDVLGKEFSTNVDFGTPLSWEMIND